MKDKWMVSSQPNNVVLNMPRKMTRMQTV